MPDLETLKFTRNDLLNLWISIHDRTTDQAGFEPGQALEYVILRAFELEGARVRYPFLIKEQGFQGGLEEIDGVIYSDGLAILIQCKDEQETTSFEPIAKLRAQLSRRPATAIGAIFSRSGYSNQARYLSRFNAPQPVLIWEFPEVEYALQNTFMREGLWLKYSQCVEEGLIDYSIIPES